MSETGEILMPFAPITLFPPVSPRSRVPIDSEPCAR